MKSQEECEQDRLAVERWINEGGHVATEAVIERERAAEDDAPALAGEALWWPPNNLCGCYLAPYLSSQSATPPTSCPRTSTQSLSRPRSTPLRRTRSAPFGDVSDIPRR
jgi:hypothetical protein